MPADITAIRRGDPAAIARAITLVESRREEHRAEAEELLTALQKERREALRVGITGIPGVGKSTFIESLGQHLLSSDENGRLAVIAVDPSSQEHGGSILGDKTRMPQLGAHPRAFVRPSPSSGILGGIAPQSHAAALVLEAAGFDPLLIETVGVGQSEAAIATLCDVSVLLQMPATGDDLQAVKKGVLETVDLIAVNKADGELRLPAERARAVLAQETGLPVSAVSALSGEGIAELWTRVEAKAEARRRDGSWGEGRRRGRAAWFESEAILRFRDQLAGSGSGPFATARQNLSAGEIPPAAARHLLTALVP